MTGDTTPQRGTDASTRRSVLRATAGAVGGSLAAAPAAAQQSARPDWGGWLEGVDGGYRDLRGNDEVTVTVGAEGNQGFYAFAPAGIWVDPGTTVKWKWTGKGGGHNVIAQSGPANLDSGKPVSDAGVHYEYTFEKTGITTYFCRPHKTLGMKGAVAVGDDVPTVKPGSTGGGGGTKPLPGGDMGALVVLGAVAAGALGVLSVFGADAYDAVRGGPDAAELGEPQAAPEREPTVELGHEEFDPTGTLALVLVYFLILLVMWVFVYFVEFLGGGPTVIG